MNFGPFGDYVLPTSERFEELLVYSLSVPSGVKPGKLWRRNCHSPRIGGNVILDGPCWQVGGYFDKVPVDPKFVETRFYSAYIAGIGYPLCDEHRRLERRGYRPKARTEEDPKHD